LIREEIGRNLRSGERFDAYPWNADDTNIEIYPDGDSDLWWASVEIPDGDDESSTKTVRAVKPSQEEAAHWARQEWEKFQRKKFAGKHQTVFSTSKDEL
jgi:hypothetical protein